MKITTKDMKACYGFCKTCPQRDETIKDINGVKTNFITCGLDATVRFYRCW